MLSKNVKKLELSVYYNKDVLIKNTKKGSSEAVVTFCCINILIGALKRCDIKQLHLYPNKKDSKPFKLKLKFWVVITLFKECTPIVKLKKTLKVSNFSSPLTLKLIGSNRKETLLSGTNNSLKKRIEMIYT